ncbi:MAG: hypothetical protein DMD81_22190, partial [Candidatus Rokuibacteriota bacterium]
DVGLARVVRALDEVTRRTSGMRVKIALENTAGAGNALGRRFAELGRMIERAQRPERLGICIDTCHLFAAGYDIRTLAGYRRAVEECAGEVGLSRVLAFHLNDARAALGSGLDRHANIGEGWLGRAAFGFLLNDPRFSRPGTRCGSEEPRDAPPASPSEDWARGHLDDVTPTRRQSARTGQTEHFGEIGVQRFCPNVTSRSL